MNKKLTLHHIKNASLDILIEAYRQGYQLENLQNVVTCQTQGQSGWAACDAFGMMCEGSTCPGGCSDISSTGSCGCKATCTNPSTEIPTTQLPTTQPPTTQPPTTIPPSQCTVNQWSIPLLGCQNKYKVLLAGGVGAVVIFISTHRGET